MGLGKTLEVQASYLDCYFAGILADDIGLGKTLEVQTSYLGLLCCSHSGR